MVKHRVGGYLRTCQRKLLTHKARAAPSTFLLVQHAPNRTTHSLGASKRAPTCARKVANL